MTLQSIINNFDITNEQSINQTIRFCRELDERIAELRSKESSGLSPSEQEELNEKYKLRNEWQRALPVLISEQVDALDNEQLQQLRGIAIQYKEINNNVLLSGEISTPDKMSQELNSVRSGSLDNPETRELVTEWLKKSFYAQFYSTYWVAKGTTLTTVSLDISDPQYDVQYRSEEERKIGEFPFSEEDYSVARGVRKEIFDLDKKYSNGCYTFQLPRELDGIRQEMVRSTGITEEKKEWESVFGNVGELSQDSLYVSLGYWDNNLCFRIDELGKFVQDKREKATEEMRKTDDQFTMDKMDFLVPSSSRRIDLLEILDMHGDKVEKVDSIKNEVTMLQSRLNALSTKTFKSSDDKNLIDTIQERLNNIRISIINQIRIWYIKNQNVRTLGFEGKGMELFSSLQNLEEYLNSRGDLLSALDELDATIGEIREKVDELSEQRDRDLEEVRERGVESLDKSILSDEQKREFIVYTSKSSNSIEYFPRILEQKQIKAMIGKNISSFKRKSELSEMISDTEEKSYGEELDYSSSYAIK